MNSVSDVIRDLKKVTGLNNFNVLDDADRLAVLNLEEPINTGAIESLRRQHALVITHDSRFRNPAGPIALNGFFPPVPFPEVKAKLVVSSSPGMKVHDYLAKKFKLDLKDGDATLLLGFDL